MIRFKNSLAVIFILTTLITAQQKQKISIEWIYSGESAKITRLPSYTWLDNNNAIIYDSRKPISQRTFELFNPKTSAYKSILDMKKAVESLSKFLNDNTPVILDMPAAFDNKGESAVYIFNGDIYLLIIHSAEFYRVTNTKEEEKNVNFSPDGNKLAYVRSNNIYVYDIKNKSEIEITTDGSETVLNGTLSWVYWEEIFGRRDVGYWWSPDSKSIAYLNTDESMVSVMYYPDFKPNVPDIKTQRYPKTGEKNPIVKVGVVKLEDKKTTWIDFSKNLYEYIIRVNWLPNSKQIAVQIMNRMQDQLDLFFADCFTGKVKHVLKETDPGWVNVNDDLTFIKNGKEFLWVSERSGFAHIYRYDEAGNLINQVTKGDWAVASSGGSPYWVRGAISAVDERKEVIYFTAQEKDPKEKHLYRVNYDGTEFKRLSDGNFTHRISFCPDASSYFDTYSSISTPPVLSLHNNKGEMINQIVGYNASTLSNVELQIPEIFSIPAQDGFPLPAEIMKPNNFDPNKKYPLVIYVYGGPSAPQVQNNWRSSIYFDQVLLDNGFLVAMIDPRTSTAIGKKLENMVLRNMSGEIELKDLVDGVKWFKKQSYIDSSRIGIWGWSGGGSFTLNAMTNSKEFKAGIAVAAVSDWHYYDTKFGEMAMKTPEVNPKGYEKTSYVKSAKNLHGRLMIVHGSYDDNVHIQNAWAFADELIKANIMFDMMIYPMRKHGISDRPARIHLYNKMLEFWKNNL